MAQSGLNNFAQDPVWFELDTSILGEEPLAAPAAFDDFAGQWPALDTFALPGANGQGSEWQNDFSAFLQEVDAPLVDMFGEQTGIAGQQPLPDFVPPSQGGLELPARAASVAAEPAPAAVAGRRRGRPPKAEEDKVKPTFYRCKYCTGSDKTYKGQELLHNHMCEKHQVIAPDRQASAMRCPQCSKLFLRSTDLKKHSRGRWGCQKEFGVWNDKDCFRQTPPDANSPEEMGDVFGREYGPTLCSLVVGAGDEGRLPQLPKRRHRETGTAS